MFNPLVDAVDELGTTYVDLCGFVHNGCLGFTYVEGGYGVVFIFKCLYLCVEFLPHFAEVVVACGVFAAENGGGEGGVGGVRSHGVVSIVRALFVSF